MGSNFKQNTHELTCHDVAKLFLTEKISFSPNTHTTVTSHTSPVLGAPGKSLQGFYLTCIINAEVAEGWSLDCAL